MRFDSLVRYPLLWVRNIRRRLGYSPNQVPEAISEKKDDLSGGVSAQLARAMEEATGVKGETFTVKWPDCQDVPNFLKAFEARQKRLKDISLQLD